MQGSERGIFRSILSEEKHFIQGEMVAKFGRVRINDKCAIVFDGNDAATRQRDVRADDNIDVVEGNARPGQIRLREQTQE